MVYDRQSGFGIGGMVPSGPRVIGPAGGGVLGSSNLHIPTSIENRLTKPTKAPVPPKDFEKMLPTWGAMDAAQREFTEAAKIGTLTAPGTPQYANFQKIKDNYLSASKSHGEAKRAYLDNFGKAPETNGNAAPVETHAPFSGADGATWMPGQAGVQMPQMPNPPAHSVPTTKATAQMPYAGVPYENDAPGKAVKPGTTYFQGNGQFPTPSMPYQQKPLSMGAMHLTPNDPGGRLGFGSTPYDPNRRQPAPGASTEGATYRPYGGMGGAAPYKQPFITQPPTEQNADMGRAYRAYSDQNLTVTGDRKFPPASASNPASYASGPGGTVFNPNPATAAAANDFARRDYALSPEHAARVATLEQELSRLKSEIQQGYSPKAVAPTQQAYQQPSQGQNVMGSPSGTAIPMGNAGYPTVPSLPSSPQGTQPAASVAPQQEFGRGGRGAQAGQGAAQFTHTATGPNGQKIGWDGSKWVPLR